MNLNDERIKEAAKQVAEPKDGRMPTPEECFFFGMIYALKNQWRDTSESLPNDNAVVLIVDGDAMGEFRESSIIEIATFYEIWEDESDPDYNEIHSNVFYTNTGCLYLRESVSHWMPIPRIPANKEEDVK